MSPKVTYRFSAINSCLNPNDDFGRNTKTHPKIHVDTQVTLNNQSKLEKEEQNWRINTCWLQSLLKATAYYWHNRYKDQQNSIESLEINSCIYGQMISDKDAKTIVGKITVFSTHDAGKSGYAYGPELSWTLS